jgi:hypothetical protein
VEGKDTHFRRKEKEGKGKEGKEGKDTHFPGFLTPFRF